MTTNHILSVAIFLTATSLTAVAQEVPGASASSPMASTSMPQDCAKPMPKHDHGAEKGASKPMSISGSCASAAGTSAAKPRHDHARFHKNQ